MTTTKQYDYLNRLTVHQFGSSAHRLSAIRLRATTPPTSAPRSPTPTARTGCINTTRLGQVTSGRKYWSDGTPVAGQQFQYQFDTIGNRTGTDAGGDELGANLHHATYTPDSSDLNQYASRDVPGYVQSLGTASASANVPSGRPTALRPGPRKGAYFRAELPVTNSSAPQWVTLTNVAVLPGGSSADTVTNVAGSLFVAQTPEQFTYDADGNLHHRRPLDLHLGRGEPADQPGGPHHRRPAAVSRLPVRLAGPPHPQAGVAQHQWQRHPDHRREVRL